MGTKLLLPCLVAFLYCALGHAGFAGKEFATVFMQNYKQNYRNPSFEIQISALHADTKVKVTVPSMGFAEERTLGAGQGAVIKLPAGVEMFGSRKSSKTVRIEATQEVTVKSLNFKPRTGDTSLVYPVTQWGTEYYVFTPSSSPIGTNPEFSITNHKQRNSVQIFPLVPVRFQGRTRYPGNKIEVELEPFESLQIQGTSDLTGTRVVSTLPVAVSAGHSCTWKFSQCNHVYEQLLPVPAWGKSFLVAGQSFQTRFDTVYIQASQTTKVVIKTDGKDKAVHLTKGHMEQFHIQKGEGALITADQGVQVLYLFNGVRVSWSLMYDPFLMTVLPTDTFCSWYTLNGQDRFDNKALLMVRDKDVTGLRFDGAQLDVQFRQISGSGFSWAEVAFKAGAGLHGVVHPTATFGAYSIGVGDNNGYGAPASCGHSGEGPAPLSCSIITCSADEECQMKDGYPTCVKKQPAAICWAMGDPHYHTFDGLNFDFQGTCTYVNAKNCQANDSLPAFKVETRNENRGNARVSYVSQVTVEVYGVTIDVIRSETGIVRIDYSTYRLPVVLKEDKLKLYQRGRSVVIEADFGLTVQYDWESYIVVTATSALAGKVCGLCGNFNGDPEDDFATPSGSQAANAVDFGRSWKVEGAVKGALCQDDCKGKCDKCEHELLESWKDKLFCGLLTNEDGPFRLCHAAVDPNVYLRNCLYDMCMGDGLRHFLCKSLEAYASACQAAGIEVFDWRTIARCQNNLIFTLQVDGELTNLPVYLSGGKVYIYRSGEYAVVKTNFGLKLMFDWNAAVFVTLPSTFRDSVCGLCGNYNGKSQDDLTERGGQVTTDIDKFAASWRVAEIPGCVHGCEGACPDCDITQARKYEGDGFCGILPDPKGPFRDCLAKVDPSGFFKDCVYDVCLYKGWTDVLCKAIADYTTACQESGVEVYPWRSDTFCPKKCQLNSHYEICGSGCPTTCQSLAPPRGCDSLCREGCTCDDGFILSGDRCVPLSQCGAVYDNRYYRIGEVFYPDVKCEEECTTKRDGEVVCKKFSCGANEKCELREGKRKCQPVGSGRCVASGDPHYTSFDGLTFDFQGTCTYTMAEGCNLTGTHLVAFSVRVENERWTPGLPGKVAVTELVAVEVYGFQLVMRENVFGVFVDGVLNNVPLNLNDGAVEVYLDGKHYTVKTDFGLVVTYDLVYYVTVTVPGNYRGKTCGLCGNFNGNNDDDFRLPNGTLARDATTFGKAWKVPVAGVVCDDGCQGNTCPKCDTKQKKVFESPGYCGILTDPKGPFAACHAKLDPAPFFDDCVFDICAAKGDREVLCDSAAAYALSCRYLGIDIAWRTKTFCPLSCAAHSSYAVCADTCSNACPGLAEIVSCPADTCTAGCGCDAGFLFDGAGCIQSEKCGCYDNGHSYKPGEVVYHNDCKQECTCHPTKGLRCTSHTCPSGTQCLIRKGVMACVSTDPCKDAKCRAKEDCKVEKGEAVCVPLYTGKCWAWGDPHYGTFDGLNFNFQGTCKYTVIKTCGDTAGLTPFAVEERNDNRGGNTAVSYVREVDVLVYGQTFTFTLHQTGRVMVDGELHNLPLEMPRGQVTVVQSRNAAVLETAFGLRVSYDWNERLDIELPSSYYDAVCGLCGNFNGDAGDELRDPAGKPVPSVLDWAKSWRVPDAQDPYCWDSCEPDCPKCTRNLQKRYETEAYCGALTVKVEGVFSECHGAVDPKPFMDDCVYDVCHNDGAKTSLCQALASYAETCMNEGIVPKDWRTIVGCPMACQPHSHYEKCASPCPVTCPIAELRTAHALCQGVCSEGCVCDKGYILSAGKCVPEKECGCMYRGRYYEPAQSFWGDAGCSELCTCDQALGMVVCKPAACKAGEQCALVDGVRSCQPAGQATCSASTDPHYRTFDGRHFDFQGTCVYLLASLCAKGDPGLAAFEVTVQNDHRGGNKAVSFTKVVTVSVYGVTVSISKDYPYKIMVDGQFTSMPFRDGDKLSVFRSGWTAVVETAIGVRVTFDWNNRVTVTVPSTYQGAVCGLCGNYNGNPGDDWTMPSGKPAANESQLGESWQVGEVPGCVPVCEGPECRECTKAQVAPYIAPRYCGIIGDEKGPFHACHARVDPAPYQADCAFDACHAGGHPSIVCEAVVAYVSACQSDGVAISSWRSDTFCPASCPKNSHYELCGAGCPATCSGEPARCRLPCREGCQCDRGHVLSGDACVSVADCGCTYGGRYYRKGEEFFPDGGCGRRCTCGENGAVECAAFECGAGEACKVVGGVGGCHPTGEGKCVASGDPHYISFDGRGFDFQGKCVYTLAKLCDKSGKRLEPFTVEESNEKYRNSNAAVTRAVAVLVYGYVITVEQGVRGKVTVDDEEMNLPLSLDEGRVTVNQEGMNVVVRTDFGLRVLYDAVYYVEVVVPSTYQGRMCGLCGNYNGRNNDDFLLPDGKLARNEDQFGEAWTADAAGLACGGCGAECPVCKEADAAVHGKPDACGILIAPAGPFQPCHAHVDPKPYFQHCVFDVCALNGDRGVLCKSVQAYAIACQDAGVKIKPWRSATFCPPSCPANSHYEMCADTCENTCASLMVPSTCSATCFEGCQCDSGFVSDGDVCVSTGTCGCIYEGRYLKVGQSVVSKTCDSRCTCRAATMACEKLGCAAEETCSVRDGVRGCHPKEGVCSIQGFARHSSFDDMKGAAGFYLDGTVEAASLCDRSSAEWFRVVVELRVCEAGGGRSSESVVVHVFFKDTVVSVNDQKEAWVNGMKASLPASPVKGLTVHVTSKAVMVERWLSVRVAYYFTQEVRVTVGLHLAGKMCGACGNYNGDPTDDHEGSWIAGDFSRCSFLDQ